ncbi:hypothetical protein SADUNF_Sadunf02G0160100 [Salix dunnii]|uniref:Uncharacterized protein n=1 Tax=Salix dunnii TaxID=1413687 RepID=A0A835THQ2_9ROSI|nr:hypothetical protein SADUNF_Sadunf02G0160100 [Salix dunnii]
MLRTMVDALIAFDKIYDAGIVPNRVTMVNALGACAGFGAMEMGVWTHHFLRRNEWELDVIMGTLIDEGLKKNLQWEDSGLEELHSSSVESGRLEPDGNLSKGYDVKGLNEGSAYPWYLVSNSSISMT